MQRAQAILLVLVLFAAPLALLARASSGMGADCNNLCCLLHGSHASHSHAAHTDSKEEGMACHRGDAGRAANCSMKSSHYAWDYGFLAPIAPTSPSAIVRLVLPAPSRADLVQSIDAIPSALISPPFEPPRS
ncbi:MAG TPA: hypothetical protein VNV84_06170 [Candidatus Acidoferrales bacterium]|nr:hypothetical protein [Candidatus Acidoferrales bacterium]